ncbi:T9SS type A sorting domain-containing protein [Chryseobacterium contaminans]|uniref:T9SS type A sorting domain-containing protein n=1 Tax=Chryseobacterium contaminans TaxID=1423959 RepID=UPI003015F29E
MVGDLYFAVRNLGLGMLLMVGGALNAQQSCINTDPGNNVGDLGCVSFTYRGQSVTYTTVRTADGNIWLKQNLGSERVAEALDDEESYGDLFQWGRWDDGHQLRNSPLISSPSDNTPEGLPGSGSFIIGSPGWWSSNGADDKWAGKGLVEVTETMGADPCRVIGLEWKLPSQADWANVVQAENIISPVKAYGGNLKLPMGGYRSSSDGGFTFVGKRGYFWSSNAATTGGKYLYIGSTVANASAGGPRGQGASVRCMKSQEQLGTADIHPRQNRIDVYPNPVKGILTLKSDSLIEHVRIINAAGQRVEASFSGNQINMNNLPSDLYIIELKLNNGESVVKKIIKN